MLKNSEPARPLFAADGNGTPPAGGSEEGADTGAGRDADGNARDQGDEASLVATPAPGLLPIPPLTSGATQRPPLTRDEIVEVVTLAREREEPVVLSPQGLDVSFFCVIVEVSSDHVVIRNPVPPNMATRMMAATAFSLFCRMYLLRSERLEPYGTLIRFPLPEFAAINQARQLERVHFAAKENAIVEIQHPFDSSTVLRRRVFDLSTGGMSFRARRKTPFIQPGRVLPACRIVVQGKPYETRRGRVVYVKQIIDVNAQSYFQVGVQFIESEEEDTV